MEKKIFKFRQCIFAILLLSPLGKRRGPSSEQTGISFTEGCFVWRFFEISPVVLEKFINVFSLFPYLFPLRKGVALYLNKLESPSPKVVLRHVWLKLAQWIFNLISSMYIFSIFRYYLPLKKVTPHLKETWIPLTQGCFVSRLVEIGPLD